MAGERHGHGMVCVNPPQGPHWTDDDDDDDDVSWFTKRHFGNCIRFLTSNGSTVTVDVMYYQH
jgi:hypothetical protein